MRISLIQLQEAQLQLVLGLLIALVFDKANSAKSHNEGFIGDVHILHILIY